MDRNVHQIMLELYDQAYGKNTTTNNRDPMRAFGFSLVDDVTTPIESFIPLDDLSKRSPATEKSSATKQIADVSCDNYRIPYPGPTEGLSTSLLGRPTEEPCSSLNLEHSAPMLSSTQPQYKHESLPLTLNFAKPNNIIATATRTPTEYLELGCKSQDLQTHHGNNDSVGSAQARIQNATAKNDSSSFVSRQTSLNELHASPEISRETLLSTEIANAITDTSTADNIYHQGRSLYRRSSPTCSTTSSRSMSIDSESD
jgi:hypothetical protein